MAASSWQETPCSSQIVTAAQAQGPSWNRDHLHCKCHEKKGKDE